LDSGLDRFTWWANALVFFATLTFLSVNVANTCLFWRFARGQFGVIGNLVLPLLGVLLNAYLIYAAFFRTLWAGSFRTGKSVVIACMALLVAQVGALLYVRLCRPGFANARYTHRGRGVIPLTVISVGAVESTSVFR
jgi:hypothetical protein